MSIEWNQNAINQMIRTATSQAGSTLQEAFDEVHRRYPNGGVRHEVEAALSSAMGNRGLNSSAARDADMRGVVDALASGKPVGVETR